MYVDTKFQLYPLNSLTSDMCESVHVLLQMDTYAMPITGTCALPTTSTFTKEIAKNSKELEGISVVYK